MAGIYIHIPFCRQACHYCNFHFSTSLKYKDEVIAAILCELEMRKDYLQGAEITSIYLGGGTPSLLGQADIEQIFNQISRLFSLANPIEITLEANPDDLSPQKVKMLRTTPINRFSIGIQSFFEEDLQFMNRAHNAEEAVKCIQEVQRAGFENITIDLIYGAPTTTDQHWVQNLQIALDLRVPHISSYCLTVEEKTALAHFVATGKVSELDENQAERQFTMLVRTLESAGFDHYEISNFALPGRYAQHNTGYWMGMPYLGVGPSAHSFDGLSRQWNVANNAAYLRAVDLIKKGELPSPPLFERETLSPAQCYNEYVMTALRTMWGVRMDRLEEVAPQYAAHFSKHIQPYVAEGLVQQEDQVFRLSPAGKFLADGIAAGVFA